MADLLIRRAVLGDDKDADETFIMDSWLRCLRRSPDSELPDSVFFPAYRLVAHTLLRSATVEIVCPPDSPGTILAYIVYDPGVVHWVYVKKDYRGSHLCKLLLERAECKAVTMTTPLGRRKINAPIKKKLLRNKLNKELL